MRRKQSPERYRELVDRAVKELKPYLADPTEERKGRLSSLCREMELEQNEYERIGWNMVRMLKSKDLVVVEKSLKSVLKSHEAPIWAYQAAKDYMDPWTVEKLEAKVEEAIAEIIVKMGVRKLPLMPSRHTMRLMAKAAVAAYEAAVGNDDRGQPSEGPVAG
jgi:hypothetical protein